MASKKRSPQRAVEPNPYVTLTSYYERLPNGWASFPESQVQGWLAARLRERSALEAIDGMPARLNPELLAGHLASASASEWIPEIAHVALLLAIRDASYAPTDRGRDDFLEWMTQLNRELFARPAISATIMVSTANVVAQVPVVWEMFHRGTPMVTISQAETAATVALDHPVGLFHALSVETQRRAFALALAQGGAVRATVNARTEITGTMARTLFEATWF